MLILALSAVYSPGEEAKWLWVDEKRTASDPRVAHFCGLDLAKVRERIFERSSVQFKLNREIYELGLRFALRSSPDQTLRSASP
jgi:hypothetical protein